MSELTDKLEKIIKQAALDGALTEEAVAQFHTLVKERDALKTANDEWDEEGRKLKRDLKLSQDRVLVLEKECETWAGREQDLLDREHACTKLEVEKECADKRVADHQKMVELIFRNTRLKKQVMTPLAPGHPDQYGTVQGGGYAQEDTVEEEET